MNGRNFPGKFGIGTFSPPLDAAGNSVRGQRAITTGEHVGSSCHDGATRPASARPGPGQAAGSARRALSGIAEG